MGSALSFENNVCVSVVVTDPVSILAFLSDYTNLFDSNSTIEGTAMYTFKYLLGEPSKPLYTQGILESNLSDKYYSFDTIRLSIFTQIVYSLLDTNVTDDVFGDVDTTLREIKMAMNNTQTSL